jgi:Zn-dependent protease
MDSPSPGISDSPEPTQGAQREPKRSLPKFLSGAVILAGLIALKLKAVILLLAERGRMLWVNPFEGFGAAQYAIAGGSMLVTVAAYAAKYPNRLGLIVGFVAITMVHEIGHAVVIRAKGLRAGYLVFIPFIGGAVTLKDQPRSVFDDAQIGLAGPIAGTVASLAFLQVYNWTRDPLYLLIALAGFVLNLINLLPIGMLDGGRISAGVTKWMWVFGGGFLTYKVIRQPNPLMLVILVLAAFQVYASIAREKEDRFYEITPRQRLAVAVAYFSLLIILGHQTFLAMDKLDALAR